MNQTPQPSGGPPWIDPDIQQHIHWRDGDVVISVPPKSGTTWTMNIVHQLLRGGTRAFDDIYAEVPWIEFLGHPEQSPREVLDRVEAMPADRRRAFKTHSAPPTLPFLPAGTDRTVKYVVIFRNPEEALVSFRPFLEKHSDAWYALWQVPREALCRPDFPSFYNEVVDSHGLQGAFFGFLAAWWPLRRAPNVLFLHFSDMKRDHEGSIRRLAAFLGIRPDDRQWPVILEHTSFDWMKRHEARFEARSAGKVPILDSGAMIRRGEAGHARDDGMTPEIAAHLRARGQQICDDAEAIDWFYRGGPLP
ncbi:sulfotransferase domain-containing protein [Pseudooceanicola sp. CBS1P-1]|uniref:Sulfotransferase domain-containing protein n=1 Tax=Pseudooceanicola albus TaxID=2692189 RepID=A0A6L7G7M8_9RHOB|nr:MULTISPECIES: sulfotransferase domain-containing protein [Pseudooceanicola]MBT9385907.1 sulfotransferase domain-containing protein [Pseudooceanicola endophyticus]MXN19672.1 hypothetical protein [Pseudooceanicola albus]